MITLPPEEISEYVYIPRELSLGYLEAVVTRALGQPVAIRACTAHNLCARNSERVSDSGATVLRLVLDLRDGRSFQLVAKVLCPDPVNIFKIDHRFESRRWEVALMRWWGQQSIPHVPAVYDTRADAMAREYWVLHEYLPRAGGSTGRAGSQGVVELAQHVAHLHAYTGQRLGELHSLADSVAPGSARTPGGIIDALACALDDDDLVAVAGLSENEAVLLSGCCSLITRRPTWVDEWDTVCVNRDFSASNTALRDVGGATQSVSFDWGAAHLGPPEEDFDVLRHRDFAADTEAFDLLVHAYLPAYAELTGREVDEGVFVERIPWARLLVTLRTIVDHLRSLEWMRWQSRSAHLIHTLVRLAERVAGEIEP